MFKPRSTHFRSGLSAWLPFSSAMVSLRITSEDGSVAGHTSNYEFRSHAVRLYMEPALSLIPIVAMPSFAAR